MAIIFSPSSPGFHPAMGRGNANARSILIALILAAATSVSAAANVYSVGDNAGWTIGANYSAWASSKTFRVGDKIGLHRPPDRKAVRIRPIRRHSKDQRVFIYNKSFHNVLEVSKADYRSCNAASPMATHASGNDSFTITRYGHRFFICGFPGHCAGGQKLDVRVPKSISAPSPTSAPPPSDDSPASGGGSGPAASAPGSAPHGNGGADGVTGFGVVVVAVAASAVALLG